MLVLIFYADLFARLTMACCILSWFSDSDVRYPHRSTNWRVPDLKCRHQHLIFANKWFLGNSAHRQCGHILMVCLSNYMMSFNLLKNLFWRANRAQYADVSFQSVNNDEVFDVSLPSMQGVDEDEGICFHAKKILFLTNSAIFSPRIAHRSASVWRVCGCVLNTTATWWRFNHSDPPAPLSMANSTQSWGYSSALRSIFSFLILLTIAL